MIYIEDNRLTEREISAREEMINVFNPALKTCLDNGNHLEFEKFQYNCCRQTAILGAGQLLMLLPDHKIKVYTAEFDDEIMHEPVHYVHAFITAEDKNHKLLIDLSRTTRPLIFGVMSGRGINYPKTNGYEKVSKISKIEEINYRYWITHGLSEYLTGMIPSMLFGLIQKEMQMIRIMSPEARDKYVKNIYDKFTDIGGKFS